jgi:hypothetical protein
MIFSIRPLRCGLRGDINSKSPAVRQKFYSRKTLRSFHTTKTHLRHRGCPNAGEIVQCRRVIDFTRNPGATCYCTTLIDTARRASSVDIRAANSQSGRETSC